MKQEEKSDEKKERT
jgi:hypothetical protein